MTVDGPWLGDACSLVDAFRRGDRTPLDELDATLGAIDRSDLNAFSFIDAEAARRAAALADVRLPFGGVPIGVKELTDGRPVPLGNNGALTIPSNIYGSPAISVPVGASERAALPIGMQVLAPHHREGWLLDLALIAERERPWPLVAPGAPA